VLPPEYNKIYKTKRFKLKEINISLTVIGSNKIINEFYESHFCENINIIGIPVIIFNFYSIIPILFNDTNNPIVYLDNWTTRWNPFDCTVEKYNNKLVVTFKTIQSIPIGIIDEISDLYPELNIIVLTDNNKIKCANGICEYE
jgi:hypothetical protein